MQVPVELVVAAQVVAATVRVVMATVQQVAKASTAAVVTPITAIAIRVGPAVIALPVRAVRCTIRWLPMKTKVAKPALRLPVIAVRPRVATAVPLRRAIVDRTAKAPAMMDPVERVRAAKDRVIKASVLKASATHLAATRPAVIVRTAPAPVHRVITVVPITMEGAPKASVLRAIAQMVIVQVAEIAHSAASAKWLHVAASEL